MGFFYLKKTLFLTPKILTKTSITTYIKTHKELIIRTKKLKRLSKKYIINELFKSYDKTSLLTIDSSLLKGIT